MTPSMMSPIWMALDTTWKRYTPQDNPAAPQNPVHNPNLGVAPAAHPEPAPNPNGDEAVPEVDIPPNPVPQQQDDSDDEEVPQLVLAAEEARRLNPANPHGPRVAQEIEELPAGEGDEDVAPEQEVIVEFPESPEEEPEVEEDANRPLPEDLDPENVPHHEDPEPGAGGAEDPQGGFAEGEGDLEGQQDPLVDLAPDTPPHVSPAVSPEGLANGNPANGGAISSDSNEGGHVAGIESAASGSTPAGLSPYQPALRDYIPERDRPPSDPQEVGPVLHQESSTSSDTGLGETANTDSLGEDRARPERAYDPEDIVPPLLRRGALMELVLQDARLPDLVENFSSPDLEIEGAENAEEHVQAQPDQGPDQVVPEVDFVAVARVSASQPGEESGENEEEEDPLRLSVDPEEGTSKGANTSKDKKSGGSSKGNDGQGPSKDERKGGVAKDDPQEGSSKSYKEKTCATKGTSKGNGGTGGNEEGDKTTASPPTKVEEERVEEEADEEENEEEEVQLSPPRSPTTRKRDDSNGAPGPKRLRVNEKRVPSPRAGRESSVTESSSATTGARSTTSQSEEGVSEEIVRALVAIELSIDALPEGGDPEEQKENRRGLRPEAEIEAEENASRSPTDLEICGLTSSIMQEEDATRQARMEQFSNRPKNPTSDLEKCANPAHLTRPSKVLRPRPDGQYCAPHSRIEPPTQSEPVILEGSAFQPPRSTASPEQEFPPQEPGPSGTQQPQTEPNTPPKSQESPKQEVSPGSRGKSAIFKMSSPKKMQTCNICNIFRAYECDMPEHKRQCERRPSSGEPKGKKKKDSS